MLSIHSSPYVAFSPSPLLAPSRPTSLHRLHTCHAPPRRQRHHALLPFRNTFSPLMRHTTGTGSDNNTKTSTNDSPDTSTSTTPTSTTPTSTSASTSSPVSSASSSPPERPNITKYKSQRSILSSEKGDVTAVEVNDLMVKAGKEARDIAKWEKALKGSFAVVTARLVSGGKLVGFARATSDHALNGTIWDVVTDPALPDEVLMKRNVVKYLLKELRRTVPGCSIALFSSVEDRQVFEGLDFVSDPDGIRGMALFDPSKPHYL